MRIPLRRTSAFTLVEMLVGITIFSIGLVGVAMLFQSAIHASLYSRHEIVAGNLLREQIELVKNLRDSNWRSFRDWNKAFVTNQLGGEEEKNLSPGIFLIENN
jgi:prepilin-type N-terminal cleavage/methylation domain-containing protein